MSIEDTIRSIVREELKAMAAELAELVRASPAPAVAEAMLTVDQVAELAGGVKPETVRRWIDAGHLRARRAGHRWVVRPADLEAYLSRGAGERETLSPDKHLQLVTNRIAKAGGRR